MSSPMQVDTLSGNTSPLLNHSIMRQCSEIRPLGTTSDQASSPATKKRKAETSLDSSDDDDSGSGGGVFEPTPHKVKCLCSNPETCAKGHYRCNDKRHTHYFSRATMCTGKKGQFCITCPKKGIKNKKRRDENREAVRIMKDPELAENASAKQKRLAKMVKDGSDERREAVRIMKDPELAENASAKQKRLAKMVKDGNDITTAKLLASQRAAAAAADPTTFDKHGAFFDMTDALAASIIKSNTILANIRNRVSGFENTSFYIFGYRQSNDTNLDRFERERFGVASDRGNSTTYPIITTHNNGTLTKEQLINAGFRTIRLVCQVEANGVHAFPTPLKGVCNAVEKALHKIFSCDDFAVGRRLWVVDGAGGVGIRRDVLNKLFSDCNLPKAQGLTPAAKEQWLAEKATWEARAGFNFGLGLLYHKQGLPSSIKLQYDEASGHRTSKVVASSSSSSSSASSSSSDSDE